MRIVDGAIDAIRLHAGRLAPQGIAVESALPHVEVADRVLDLEGVHGLADLVVARLLRAG